MREFKPFAERGKHDGVIANDVAAAQRMNAHLGLRAFAGDAVASVAQRILELHLAHVGEDFEQRGRGAAGRVFLEAMMHLDDFEIEAWAEDFRGLAREPEERVHAGRVVRCPHDRDARFERRDLRLLLVAVARGADDERLAVLGTEPRDGQRGVVKAEVDHRVAAMNDRREVVTEINLADDFEFGDPRRARDEHLAHAALRAGDDDSCHEIKVFPKVPTCPRPLRRRRIGGWRSTFQCEAGCGLEPRDDANGEYRFAG